MPKVFISYRRSDSSYVAHWICEKLEKYIAQEDIFIDVDTIPPGVDFRAHIHDAVGQCGVLLAVIGSRWLGATVGNGPNQGQRRLDDEADFVRTEIAAALERGVAVVPVLLDNIDVPSADRLPPDLQELAYRNAVQLRPGRDFRADVQYLTDAVLRALGIDPLEEETIEKTGNASPAVVRAGNKVGRAVRAELGPNGKGWQRLQDLALEAPDESSIGEAICQAALATRMKTGDGATRTALLVQELLLQSANSLRQGANIKAYVRGLQKGCDAVCTEIEKQATKDRAQQLKSKKHLAGVLTISANNSTEISNVVASRVTSRFNGWRVYDSIEAYCRTSSSLTSHPGLRISKTHTSYSVLES